MQTRHMFRTGVATLGAAIAVAGVQVATATARTAHAKASVPVVRVTIKGRTTTLLKTTRIKAPHGWVIRDHVAAGKCSADSAQGALNVATHGHWGGSWYASYHEYYITSIMGLRETGKHYYWGIYVNGKVATKGACEIKLHPGERLLFKVTKA